MPDILTKEQRSYNMSRIRSRNTSPELCVRRKLRAIGVRNYRLSSKLPGKPDIVFPVKKVAVFIDGCFWHMCPKCYIEPNTRKEFWRSKLLSNVERDKNNNLKLLSLGWQICRIWEHEVIRDPGSVVDRILSLLGSSIDKAGKG